MKRGLVLVEGQTEEQFVNDCLAPYLMTKGLILEHPTIITTRRTVGGPYVKGGIKSYGQVQRELGFLLRDTGASFVTTLIDYYALPTDFPGMRERSAGSAKGRVEHVEAAWTASVGTGASFRTSCCTSSRPGSTAPPRAWNHGCSMMTLA